MVAANAPRFLRQEIVAMPCLEGGHFYYVDIGWLARHQNVERVYHWTYFVVCIMTPFVFLIFCNVNLIIELRRSLRMRYETTGSRSGRGGSDSSAANRITLTLIVIVAMYFALVMPAEVMNFVREVAVSNPLYVDTYNLVVAVANAFRPNTHHRRRRDATVELSRVGGVYATRN